MNMTHEEFDLIPAYMNHGRWLVDCPACRTGWLVRQETPSLLVDVRGGVHTECSCGTVIIVQFPGDMAEIDRLLGQRSNPENRNWRPGETVFDLRIENAAHGVGGN